jgi:hypothetical protein
MDVPNIVQQHNRGIHQLQVCRYLLLVTTLFNPIICVDSEQRLIAFWRLMANQSE